MEALEGAMTSNVKVALGTTAIASPPAEDEWLQSKLHELCRRLQVDVDPPMGDPMTELTAQKLFFWAEIGIAQLQFSLCSSRRTGRPRGVKISNKDREILEAIKKRIDLSIADYRSFADVSPSRFVVASAKPPTIITFNQAMNCELRKRKLSHEEREAARRRLPRYWDAGLKTLADVLSYGRFSRTRKKFGH